MTVRIVAIERIGPGLRARRILLDDFTERTTADAAVKALGLEVGDSVTTEKLEASLAELEPELARERALRLLGHRERSVFELTQRLTQDGFPHHAAASVVTSLARAGLVDDARFAGVWAHSRVASGYGSSRILREFAERGVDHDLAERALNAALDGVEDVERARALVRQRPPHDRRERERVLRRLLSRGFDIAVATRALNAIAPLGCDEAGFPEY